MGGMSIIAKRLKEARLRAGISSQKELGIRAGINEFGASSRMNHYEQGKHKPDVLILKRLAVVVQVPVPYFYCEDDELADLILKFGTLNEVQKKRLLAFVDKL
jgi:transcriptional regulator with XRE-family HTH domain